MKWDLPSYSSGVQIDNIGYEIGTRDSIIVNLRKSCGKAHGTGITTCRFLLVQHIQILNKNITYKLVQSDTWNS